MNDTEPGVKKNPLSVVAFLDGRPGHEKQTKSVLAAIARRTPVHITFRYVQAGSYSKGFRDWLQYLGYRFFPSNRAGDTAGYDLVIGTGTYTHIPMVGLKKRYGIKAVTCMSPAYPVINDFDLCFVPQHDDHRPRENIMVTVGPPISTGALGKHLSGKGLILIGGVDKRSHRWRSGTLIEQVRSILQKQSAVMWTVSSSPRTPKTTIDAMDALVAGFDNIRFFRSENTPAGWIEVQYEENATVWVTADSISMVYEALAAGCRVGILPVDWKRAAGKFQRSIDYLIEHRWVTPFENWRPDEMLTGSPRRLDEAGRCAEEILNRWWPDRIR